MAGRICKFRVATEEEATDIEDGLCESRAPVERTGSSKEALPTTRTVESTADSEKSDCLEESNFSKSGTGAHRKPSAEEMDWSKSGTGAQLQFYARIMSEQRVGLKMYMLAIVLLALAIIVSAYAYSFNRWPDGNGSPLKQQHISIYQFQDESVPLKLGSPLSATDQVGDLAFRRYVAFVVAATCVLTGLGAEIVLGKMLLSVLSTRTGTALWHFAQLIFSLFLVVAIIGAGFHDALSLPFLVAGLYKLGFPETIGCFLAARKIGFAKGNRARAACEFLDGLGTLLHHTAGVLFVTIILVGLAPLNRPMAAASLPLVVQHWFCLLKYQNSLVYAVVMAGIEIFWEFEIFASIPDFSSENGIDRTLRPVAYIMLIAHWIYWTAGISRFFLRDAAPRPEYESQSTLSHWQGLLRRSL